MLSSFLPFRIVLTNVSFFCKRLSANGTACYVSFVVLEMADNMLYNNWNIIFTVLTADYQQIFANLNYKCSCIMAFLNLQTIFTRYLRHKNMKTAASFEIKQHLSTATNSLWLVYLAFFHELFKQFPNIEQFIKTFLSALFQLEVSSKCITYCKHLKWFRSKIKWKISISSPFFCHTSNKLHPLHLFKPSRKKVPKSRTYFSKISLLGVSVAAVICFDLLNFGVWINNFFYPLFKKKLQKAFESWVCFFSISY